MKLSSATGIYQTKHPSPTCFYWGLWICSFHETKIRTVFINKNLSGSCRKISTNKLSSSVARFLNSKENTQWNYLFFFRDAYFWFIYTIQLRILLLLIDWKILHRSILKYLIKPSRCAAFPGYIFISAEFVRFGLTELVHQWLFTTIS